MFLYRISPFYKKYIDVVTYSVAPIASKKTFYNGIYANKGKLEWKNSARDSAFDLTVFDQTLVLDTDLLISNDKLLTCFNMSEDFMIAKNLLFSGVSLKQPLDGGRTRLAKDGWILTVL